MFPRVINVGGIGGVETSADCPDLVSLKNLGTDDIIHLSTLCSSRSVGQEKMNRPTKYVLICNSNYTSS